MGRNFGPFPTHGNHFHPFGGNFGDVMNFANHQAQRAHSGGHTNHVQVSSRISFGPDGQSTRRTERTINGHRTVETTVVDAQGNKHTTTQVDYSV